MAAPLTQVRLPALPGGTASVRLVYWDSPQTQVLGFDGPEWVTAYARLDLAAAQEIALTPTAAIATPEGRATAYLITVQAPGGRGAPYLVQVPESDSDVALDLVDLVGAAAITGSALVEQLIADIQTAAQATAADRAQTGADRTQTGLDAEATAADRAQTGADRTQTGLDAAATAEDRVATGADRTQTGLDATATAVDRVATGADRTQTGLDATATAEDRVATGDDRTQTALDAAATAADRAVTTADREQTALDAAAVAAARVQRRFALHLPYTFSGVAPWGAAEDAPVWTLVRLDFTGPVIAATATATAWTERASAPYA